MSVKEQTKYLFAATIKEMLKTCTLHEVRVKDLCQMCGAERQTFYYHFKDKYDLIAWIYLKDWETSIQQAEGYFCEKQLENLLSIIKKNLSFYKRAFEDTTQNALMFYVRKVNIEITKNALKNILNIDELSEEQFFAINYNSYAWIGSIVEWTKNNAVVPVDKYAHMMYWNTTILNSPIIFEEDYCTNLAISKI